MQNKEWKYIRYYENNNLSALEKIKIAKDLGIKSNRILYGVHDNDIAVYRNYIDAPLNGEEPVYEELFHLASDPKEENNLSGDWKYRDILIIMREVWSQKILEARGKGPVKVLRYTVDSGGKPD